MYRFILAITLIILIQACGSLKVPYEAVDNYSKARSLDTLFIASKSDSLRTLNSADYLKLNPYGTWELYVSGNPFEIGDKTGLLTQELFNYQRAVFEAKLETFVPSIAKRKRILQFVKWYSRNLDKYIAEDHLVEIYALSRYLDHVPSTAMSNYDMTLIFHAAHDIGHALQDLAIVGCSSIASWGENTADGKLLIGRNLDFYAGDDFVKNKVVYFVKPDKGIPFMSVSWAGMAGVISGMNLEGLTITMNAGKSSIPLSARSPISLIARDILQNASTIDEAIVIAKQAKPFVSESLMIGSAKDNKAVLIEVSPHKIGIYEEEKGERLISTNHFQSEPYHTDKRNQKHITNSHSNYRYEKLEELLGEVSPLDAPKVAAILRNKEGLNGENIGYGNDKSINHLLAHHAIIFKPDEKMVWVSNAPYQLGVFSAYDLKSIFADTVNRSASITVDLSIPADTFVYTQAYADYEIYRQYISTFESAIKNKTVIADGDIELFKSLNSDIWVVYYLSGKYRFSQSNYELAIADFKQALTKVIPTIGARTEIEKMIRKAEAKWKR